MAVVNERACSLVGSTSPRMEGHPCAFTVLLTHPLPRPGYPVLRRLGRGWALVVRLRGPNISPIR